MFYVPMQVLSILLSKLVHIQKWIQLNWINHAYLTADWPSSRSRSTYCKSDQRQKGWKIRWISKSSTKKVSQWGMNWACSSYNWMKKGRKTDIFAATYYLFSLPTTFFSFPKELVNDLERASNIVMLMGFFPRKKRTQTFIFG